MIHGTITGGAFAADEQYEYVLLFDCAHLRGNLKDIQNLLGQFGTGDWKEATVCSHCNTDANGPYCLSADSVWGTAAQSSSVVWWSQPQNVCRFPFGWDLKPKDKQPFEGATI